MVHVIDNGSLRPLVADNGWTPQLVGDTFCSPNCGCRCTKEDFDTATALAQSIVANLGAGWEPHVWENLGWHGDARRGESRVSLLPDGHYAATVSLSKANTSLANITASSGSPEAALAAAVNQLESLVAALQRALMGLAPQSKNIEDVVLVADQVD